MSVATNLLPANTSGIETDTSGWVAGANTTLSKSSRFYVGASSLGMTATAAGTVTATTSARVAVAAGTEYTAYAYFSNVASASGRTATVRVDWYAAVTGGTAISSVTSVSSTLPNSTAWQTPPPILIATAPAGAAYVSVTVTVTGLTAGAAAVTDAIAFGPTPLLAGNLLTYNTQGVEVDTSGWNSQANVVVSRSAALAFEGWYGLTLTSAATGQMESRQVVTVPVTEGIEYTAHAWVQAAAPDLEFKVQILWYTSGGVGIGSRFSQSWVLPAATWTRCSVIGVAPAGAAVARIALSPVAATAGQLWTVDQIALRPAPVPAGSLLSYNAQGLEVDASAWTAVSGCTVSRSTDYAVEGAASLKMSPSPAGALTGTVALTNTVLVTPRQSYTVTPHVRTEASTSYRYVTSQLSWYSTENTVIRAVSLRWTLAPGAAGWFTLPSSAVAPASAARVGISIRVESPDPDPVYIDEVQLVPGGLAALVDPIPASYGASIALQGLTAGGYANWGLWRVDANGTLTPVRGAVGDLSQVPITGDLAVVEDYEAPLGVSVSYYLKVWTGSSYRGSSSDVIVIPEPLTTEVVLKDPGLPARQTTAVVAAGGQPEWTRKARQGINPIRGRAMPIVISDVRTSREGTMTLITETAQDLGDMWWLLETGNTILIQWPSLFGERDAYVAVGDVTEAPIVDFAEYSDRTWTVPLTEVDRPIGAAIGSAGRTWQTVNDTNTDWMAVMAHATSWLDVYTGVNGG